MVMSLDTLGSYIAIADGEATFTDEELVKYLDKNDVRRGQLLHPLFRSSFIETRNRIRQRFGI
jgi:hypothetical protein